MSPRRAVALSAAWFVAGLAVGAVVLAATSRERAIDYWAVYLVERSLSLDNVFVFLLILDAFAIPRPLRGRVVWWSIWFALALRALAIVLGASLIERFGFVEYLLGALLIVFAFRMLREEPGDFDPEHNRIVALTRRVMPLSGDPSSGRFIVRLGGRRALTPLG